MANFNRKIKIHMVTDVLKDSRLNFNDIIFLNVFELLYHYESLKKCSNVILNGKRLTATTEGDLLSLKILSENLTWKDLIDLNHTRKSV